MNPTLLPSTANFRLVVDVSTQTLRLEDGDQLRESFSISTSKFGLGTEPGSYRTPLGKFVISDKIGDGQPEGMQFKSREPIGRVSAMGGEDDLILTRILWLSGLDPENANTHDRYIYIHGTNQEDQLGAPASHGCIRMKNTDICRLYDLVPAGTPVEIIS